MSSSSNPQFESIRRAQSAIKSLSTILNTTIPNSLLYSDAPSHALLHDPEIGHRISTHLRHPSSGVFSDDLCRWLYETYQTSDPDLHLVVLRFVPTLIGVYLSRAVSRKPLPGFEAMILAIYAHQTKVRGNEPTVIRIPNIANPSIYHERIKSGGQEKENANRSIELCQAEVLPALEPCGTVRATKRARIAGVVLELYYSQISRMPISSNVEFCRFCVDWAGENGICDDMVEERQGGDEVEGSSGDGGEGGRIPLPWELFQPIVRIVGHCLLGPCQPQELTGKALVAARCLYRRAIHDVQPQAILAIRSLLRLNKTVGDDVLEIICSNQTPSSI